MIRKAIIMFTIAVIALALAACTPQAAASFPPTAAGMEPSGQGVSGANPGTSVTGPAIDLPPIPSGPDTGVGSSTVDPPVSPGASVDPSAALVEVSGVVKDFKSGMILISLVNGGGDFMLRISGNTQWADGVDRTVTVGNCITAKVKPEPTFAPPSQGEVFLVLKNG